MTNFTIIICTYNPDEILLKRLLNAVSLLSMPKESEIEVLIIDNNSAIPVKNLLFVSDFLTQSKQSQVIHETKQGLTSARITGIEHARFETIIFFDDDNEPKSDYLLHCQSVLAKNSRLACVGPGTISVDFVGEPPPDWILKRKDYFQEKTIVNMTMGPEMAFQ